MAKSDDVPCDHDHGFWHRDNPFFAWSSRFGGMLALLTLILWCSASSFDSTELTVIVAFATAVGLGKGAEVLAGKLK